MRKELQWAAAVLIAIVLFWALCGLLGVGIFESDQDKFDKKCQGLVDDINEGKVKQIVYLSWEDGTWLTRWGNPPAGCHAEYTDGRVYWQGGVNKPATDIMYVLYKDMSIVFWK